jgi:NAD/NADP transhydrogenase beta subunit
MMNTILNFIHVAGNVLLHSIRTATFCWVAVGLVVVILAIRGVTKKKKGEKQDNNYCLEGMSLGMCFGLLIGTMLGNYIGVAISLGMIVGLAIGMCIPKKTEGGDK